MTDTSFWKTILFIAIIVIPTFVGCGFCGTQNPFDPVKWREGGEGDVRHQMVEDLARNHLKTTMTKDDIKMLLGMPDEEIGPPLLDGIVVFGIPLERTKITWRYDFHGPSCNWCTALNISFDEKGFYHSYYIGEQ